MQPIITEYPNYFTDTNLKWKKLLQPDKYKDIVISSMKFLVQDKRVKIFSFVIMDNHLHLISRLLIFRKYKHAFVACCADSLAALQNTNKDSLGKS